jgi:triacylglycerol lipase
MTRSSRKYLLLILFLPAIHLALGFSAASAADKPCVVLLHGLLRNSQSMDWMALDLRRAGYSVIVPDYPSTRRTLHEHSEWLRSFIDSLPCDSIDLVAHSLGALIARDYLSQHRPEKVKRLVMIAPPNHGAEKADQYRHFFMYNWVFGKVSQAVTSDSLVGPDRLGIPHCPFGIIAGGKGTQGYSKRIPGNDDGVLSVGKAYLKGAQDFLILTASHNAIIREKECSDNVISFLRTGKFLTHSSPPSTDSITAK